MKINLDYELKIDVRENNKTKEKLVIFYREFTKAEKKEQKEMQDAFSKILKKLQKISQKDALLSKKAHLYELSGEFKKSLDCLDKKEKLSDELESLSAELDVLGGENKDEFTENTSKERFEKQVSGSGKEKLKVYAEIKGYTQIIKELDIAKAELEKKQSGE